MMRILMLAQFYPPIMGGIERHVKNLSAALSARGHQVAVVTLWHKGLPEFEMDGEVKVYRVHGTMQRLTKLFTADRQHSPPFPDPEVMFAIRSIIRREKPDIVHAHNWIVHSFLPIKRWSRAKLVVTLHDCELACVQMRMMYFDSELCSGPAFRKCLRCASHHYGSLKGPVTLVGNSLMSKFEKRNVDKFLPVSHAVAEANGLAGSRVPFEVVPNFIPDFNGHAEEITDIQFARLPVEGFILQVGDLVRDKGIEVLLEAYAGLQSAPPLVLVGRRFPESPGTLPPNVIVIEGLSHAAVMQAWKRSIFGVVPSICLDACPTVTMEAMASGRAVIGSRIGGITDQIVDGKTGFLVPSGDVSVLQNAMKTLISNRVLREQMGKAAIEKVSEYRAGHVVSQIERIYQTL
jgi:glycosyltransferase involved in cell wall biosynthesis